MNTVLLVTLAILIIFALSQGMLWIAIGVGGLVAVLQLAEKRSPVYPRGNFLYPSPKLRPIGESTSEQGLYIKNQTDWSGHEDDQEYANLVGEKWGSGIGRGLGFLR